MYCAIYSNNAEEIKIDYCLGNLNTCGYLQISLGFMKTYWIYGDVPNLLIKACIYCNEYSVGNSVSHIQNLFLTYFNYK